MNKLVIKNGDRYNKLTIIKEVDPVINKNGYPVRKVLVQCDCGNTKEVFFYALRNGNSTSCGCVQKESMSRAKSLDINVGDVFNKLTILREMDGHIEPSTLIKVRMFLCKCECGNEKAIRLSSLTKGSTTSCGCYRREISSQNGKLTTHGLYYHPLYNTWASMIQRCYNKKRKRYGDYGGRGITVCKRWLDNPQNFFDDMGEKPTPNHSIDRIDNDGNYEPSNCKWSTYSDQNNNRRPFRPYKRKNKNMKT